MKVYPILAVQSTLFSLSRNTSTKLLNRGHILFLTPVFYIVPCGKILEAFDVSDGFCHDTGRRTMSIYQAALNDVEIRILSKKHETQTLNTLAIALCIGIALGAILKNFVLGLCLALVFDAVLERRNKGAERKQ